MKYRVSLTGAALLGIAACLPLALATAQCLRLPVDEGPGVAMVLAVPQSAVAMVLAALAVALLTPWLARVPVAARLALVRTAGIVLLLGAVVMVAMGLERRRGHDDPDALRASIVQVGCFAVRDHLEAHGVQADVRYGCLGKDDWTCSLTLRDEDGRRDAVKLSEDAFGGCMNLCLLRARGHAWLVRSATSGVPLEALQGSPPQPRDASVASFAHELAPPLTWCLSALLGVLLALGMLVPRKADRGLAALLAWREDVVAGERVLVDPRAPVDAYRAFVGADGGFVVRGTRASVRADLARRRAGRWAFAVATVAVFGTPLAVAAGFGLLG